MSKQKTLKKNKNIFLKSVGTSQVFKNSSVLILGNQMTNMWTRQCCFTAAFNNC